MQAAVAPRQSSLPTAASPAASMCEVHILFREGAKRRAVILFELEPSRGLFNYRAEKSFRILCRAQPVNASNGQTIGCPRVRNPAQFAREGFAASPPQIFFRFRSMEWSRMHAARLSCLRA
jgi:hypothetical protein